MLTRRTTARSPIINVMSNAAFKVARSLRRDFGEVEHLQVSQKGPVDFVSTAYKRAEKTLFEELHKTRPSYGFLMEESGVIEGKDPYYFWIIDPLDGTHNFLHGVPHFAISIGLQKHDEIIAGVVYNPIHDEMFWAEKGGGAFVNERRLRVSSRKRLENSMIATGKLNRVDSPSAMLKITKLASQVGCIRQFGSASLDLSYVAAGRLDGYWAPTIQTWDLAAGLIIAREAGGYIRHLDKRKKLIEAGDIVSTNSLLIDSLCNSLNLQI
jgi:myo-inositol-1(or 4)-monophosphatase